MKSRQQGFLILGAVVLIVIGGLLTSTTARIVQQSAHSFYNQIHTIQSYYIARAGLERATYELTLATPTLTCDTLNGSGTFNNIPFSNGYYTVTATTRKTSTVGISPGTLMGDTSDSATIITMVPSDNYTYATEGRVKIDNESINYYGTSTSTTTCGVPSGPVVCLLNATRGVAGSTKASYTTGAQVKQNQCDVVATGWIIDENGQTVASSQQRRTIVLKDSKIGLFVGATDTNQNPNQPFITSWTSAGELTRKCPTGGNTCPTSNSPPNAPATPYFDIFVLSDTEGWAVGPPAGGVALFAKWDGTRLTRDTSLASSVPVVTYNKVFCVSSNNCWAVGDQTIVHWDGSQWSTTVTGGILSNICLRDVTCTDPNECWAVGSWVPCALDATLGDSTRFTNSGNSYPQTVPPDLPGGGKPQGAPIFHYTPVSGWVREPGTDSAVTLQMSPTSSVPGDAMGTPLGNNSYYLTHENNGSNRHLFGITCPTKDECWAVGAMYSLFHWTRAGGWKFNALFPPLRCGNLNTDVPFMKVACSARDNCWAIGLRDDCSGSPYAGKSLICYYNSSDPANLSWGRITQPASIPDSYFFLTGIAYISKDSYWTVGQQTGGWGLVVKWDGGVYNNSTFTRVGSAPWSPPASGLPTELKPLPNNKDIYGIGYVHDSGSGSTEIINW